VKETIQKKGELLSGEEYYATKGDAIQVSSLLLLGQVRTIEVYYLVDLLLLVNKT
jgi:hypothetical protein